MMELVENDTNEFALPNVMDEFYLFGNSNLFESFVSLDFGTNEFALPWRHFGNSNLFEYGGSD